MNKGTFNTNISTYETDCDFRGELTCGAYLRHVQEVARLHCNTCGLTSKVYANTNTAFLLAKLSLKIFHPAHMHDVLSVTTNACAPKYAIYNRYTEFSLDGTLIASTMSRWVLVDRDTHTILKNPPAGFPMVFDAVFDAKPIKIEKAPALPCGQASASYSRCDINMHMNNTKYADVICDMLPTDALLSSTVKQLDIIYHNELTAFEQMEISRAKTERGYYFSGHSGDKCIFEAFAAL